MTMIKFTFVELKKRVKEFVLEKLRRLMLDKNGFSGIDRTELKNMVKNSFPDLSDTIMLELLNELKTANIVEEV